MMVGLNCDHPDIYEFLHIKQNNEKLASMNISILFTDEFMTAVRDDTEFTLHFKVESTGETICRTIQARKFFEEFCRTQWDWGDPGALFIDPLNNYTLLSGYPEYKIEITNPCGEFGGNAITHAIWKASISTTSLMTNSEITPSSMKKNLQKLSKIPFMPSMKFLITAMIPSPLMKTAPASTTGARWASASTALPMP